MESPWVISCQSRADGYLAVAHLDQALALELAHHLRDCLTGGYDHVRQVLVGKVHVEDRGGSVGLPETGIQVLQQLGKTCRDLPVEEAIHNFLGLLEALKERGEQLQDELRFSFYDLDQHGLPYYGHPGGGQRLGKYGLPRPLLEAQLPKNVTLLEECHRGLLVVAVDLVEPYRPDQDKVKMSVGVPRGEDVVLGPIASLSHPDARVLEIFEGEAQITGGRGGRFWVVLDHFCTSPLQTLGPDVCEDDHLTNEYAPGAAGCHQAF